MLGYEFVSLSPQQLAARRRQLDQAGFLGWLSPIVLVVFVCVARLALGSIRGPSVHRTGNAQPPSFLRLQARRISWILNTTYVPEFGPLHVQLLGVAYLTWLIYLVYRDTGNDYLHLTKAFGHVAVSQWPVHYLLAFKSPNSPVTLAIGLTHERLNAYHRTLGRIIHGLLATHAILYLRFFILTDLLAKRIQHRDVRLGIIAFWSFNILGLLTIPLMRKKVYHKVFYTSHVFVSALVIPVLFFHVPYTRRYVVQAGIFWLLNGYLRLRACVKAKVHCERDDQTGLVQTTLKFSDAASLHDYVPGQHIYLRQGKTGPRNPFTIAWQDKWSTGLIIRSLGGPGTSSLSLGAEDKPTDVVVEGPYGESAEYLPQLVEAGRGAGQVLLVAGGIGATYIIPIYISLLQARGDTGDLRMLWLVKNEHDVEWAVKRLKDVGKPVDIEVYVTQTNVDSGSQTEPLKGLKIVHTGSRPDLDSIVESAIALKGDRPANGSLVTTSSKRDSRRLKKTYERVTVFVCGPPGLAQCVRQVIGKHVLGYGREVDWYEEQFGFGGS